MDSWMLVVRFNSHLICVSVASFPSVVVHSGGQEMELDVRMGHIRSASHETARLQVTAGTFASFPGEPLETNSDHVVRKAPTALVVQRHWLLARVLDVQLQMVLQISAYTGQVLNQRDLVVEHVLRVTHSRNHQQLRTVDRPTTKNHLLFRVQLKLLLHTAELRQRKEKTTTHPTFLQKSMQSTSQQSLTFSKF